MWGYDISPAYQASVTWLVKDFGMCVNFWHFAKMRGSKYRPQFPIILIMGTLQKAPEPLGNLMPSTYINTKNPFPAPWWPTQPQTLKQRP